MSEEEFFRKLDEHLGNIGNIGSSDGKPCDYHGRLCYGLRGIQDLFHCSHRQAQYYKDFIIADAVSQNGRKIVVDVDRALELFNQRKTK